MWLVTAGPTREHLDDVRFLSNASSGRMGFAIAAAARADGHEVRLVSGPVGLETPPGVETVRVTSAAEMLAAGRKALEERAMAVVIGVAAVCDFRPAQRQPGKAPKERLPRTIELVENPDVIASLAALRRARLHVGFALEALGEGPEGFGEAVARAEAKRVRKGLEAIVLNGTTALDAARSQAWWLDGSGPPEPFGEARKEDLAAALVSRIERALGPA